VSLLVIPPRSDVFASVSRGCTFYISNGEMFDIEAAPPPSLKEVWGGGEPELLVVRGRGLTRRGVSQSARDMTVSLCLHEHWSHSFPPAHWSPQQAGHMADTHRPGLRLEAGVPPVGLGSPEKQAVPDNSFRPPSHTPLIPHYCPVRPVYAASPQRSLSKCVFQSSVTCSMYRCRRTSSRFNMNVALFTT